MTHSYESDVGLQLKLWFLLVTVFERFIERSENKLLLMGSNSYGSIILNMLLWKAYWDLKEIKTFDTVLGQKFTKK